MDASLDFFLDVNQPVEVGGASTSQYYIHCVKKKRWCVVSNWWYPNEDTPKLIHWIIIMQLQKLFGNLPVIPKDTILINVRSSLIGPALL